MAELLLHIAGYKVHFDHPFKDNCEIIEIDIVDGVVKDGRPLIDVASRVFFGGMYVKPKSENKKIVCFVICCTDNIRIF